MRTDLQTEMLSRNTDAILTATDINEIRIPNGIVKLNNKGEFLTCRLNKNALPKTIELHQPDLERLENFSVHNFSRETFQITASQDKRAEIIRQLHLEHVGQRRRV